MRTMVLKYGPTFTPKMVKNVGKYSVHGASGMCMFKIRIGVLVRFRLSCSAACEDFHNFYNMYLESWVASIPSCP